ncbi:MAG: LLM class flavin-dependent oxidoreductase [Chloroflexi bacterium]|nr:LLM class flavin-dependent oxidoreductase [Chloroflexota bacterium]
MRFSVRLNNDLPAASYPQLAHAAEQAGFDQFWVSDDLFLRGVWPILTACALATQRIQIGTCIVNPATMHPAEIAMQAAALDELSGGRFNLGIAAGAAEFLGWVGLEQRHPLATVAETIEILHTLFAGHAPSPPWGDQARLRFATRRIPIYLGATSPKMVRLIGALADGGLPLLFPPEHYADVSAQVHAAAIEAGRLPTQIDLAACVWVSVASEQEIARDALREKIAYYAPALSDAILSRLGVERAEVAAIGAALQVSRDMARARALVDDRLMRIGIAGDGTTVAARLDGLVALGARHLSFGPPLGPDPLRAIALLGREVLPRMA